MKINGFFQLIIFFIFALPVSVVAEEPAEKKAGVGIQSQFVQIPLTEQSVQVHQTAVYLKYRFQKIHLEAGLSESIEMQNDQKRFEKGTSLLFGFNYLLPFQWVNTPTTFSAKWNYQLTNAASGEKNHFNLGLRQYVNKRAFIGTGLLLFRRDQVNQFNWNWVLGIEL